MLKLDFNKQPFPPENKYIEYKERLTKNIKREIGAFLNNAIVNGITKSYIIMGVSDQSRTITISYTASMRHNFEEILSAWINSAFHPDPTKYIHLRYRNRLFYIEIDSSYHKVFSTNVSNNNSNYHVYRRVGSLSKPTNYIMEREMLLKSIPHNIDSRDAYCLPLKFAYFKKILIKHNLPTLNLKTYDGLYKTANNRPTMTAQILSDENQADTSLAAFKGNTLNSPFLDNKIFKGSILKQIDQADAYLRDNDHSLSTVIGPVRKGVRDYPLVAIREALINAEVHRSYIIPSAVVIKIFKNRMTFTSPGTLPDGMTVNDAIYGNSDPTNPHLFDILELMNYVEHIGNGMKLIRNSYKNFKKSPKLESQHGFVTLILPNKNYDSQRKHDKHSNNNFNVNRYNGLTSKEKVIKYLETNKRITRARVEYLCDVKTAQAGRILRNLRANNLIEKHGNYRNAYYTKLK